MSSSMKVKAMWDKPADDLMRDKEWQVRQMVRYTLDEIMDKDTPSEGKLYAQLFLRHVWKRYRKYLYGGFEEEFMKAGIDVRSGDGKDA